jgi:hypothetical protein
MESLRKAFGISREHAEEREGDAFDQDLQAKIETGSERTARRRCARARSAESRTSANGRRTVSARRRSARRRRRRARRRRRGRSRSGREWKRRASSGSRSRSATTEPTTGAGVDAGA